MELWVRSQDKEYLIKIYNISIGRDNEILGNLVSDDNKSICDYWVLGTYKTKKRALEILDEIQRILHPTLFLSAEINTNDDNWVEKGILYQKYKDSFNIQTLSTYVYEMPEE